jgi:pantoate--beta-alanine ligase
MRIIRTASAIQHLALRWKRAGIRVAFVPTMGCLHAGHLKLLRTGRRIAGPRGVLVASIYVNPTQFGPNEDFARYPRNLRRDARLCHESGVDVVFAPSDREMYPGEGADAFSTYVVEHSLSAPMEGAARPTHFRGVTTVVAKLLNLVLPDVAVFGEKDFQQAAVIRRMVRDLNLPVRIRLAPTVRECDGLAMSSRNQYLSPPARAQATVLSRAIRHARSRVRSSRDGISAVRLKSVVRRLVTAQPDARLDYVEAFDAASFSPVRRVRRGDRVALAVFIGHTRLIDNGGM